MRRRQLRAATQEFNTNLWNPKADLRFHNSRPPVPVLGQINPVHTTYFYLSKIHLNIILPPTSKSS
jgi:hypothetical protein